METFDGRYPEKAKPARLVKTFDFEDEFKATNPIHSFLTISAPIATENTMYADQRANSRQGEKYALQG